MLHFGLVFPFRRIHFNSNLNSPVKITISSIIIHVIGPNENCTKLNTGLAVHLSLIFSRVESQAKAMLTLPLVTIMPR